MKNFVKKHIGDLFLSRRCYVLLSALAVLFLVRFFVRVLDIWPFILLLVFAVAVCADYVMLFFTGGKVRSERICAPRFSNGDENRVTITLVNCYPFLVEVDMIDEIPFQFQKRDIHFHVRLLPGETRSRNYSLRPVKRGEYAFGKVRIYVMSRLGCIQRRFLAADDLVVKVYPAFQQLRNYQLMAETNRWSDMGIKKRRLLGHSMEFDQIKEYVQGDDYRTVNWKATARTGNWMVNHYTEEKSQQIYSIIDKGRVMKMPFEGLSLLDYAVNASLALLHVALGKHDKAGLMTFAERPGAFLRAERKTAQMQAILETLYGQKTRYLESDFERLYVSIRKNIPQRSLLVLFTNFETLSGLQRQLPYLKKIARYHLLLVIFFENTELKQLLEEAPADTEGIYTQVIAEKFAHEKKRIVRELQQCGILSILTAPSHVTVNVLNKYLELKARQAI